MHFNLTLPPAPEDGQAVVEYAILLALIFVAAIVFLPGINAGVVHLYQSARDALAAVL